MNARMLVLAALLAAIVGLVAGLLAWRHHVDVAQAQARARAQAQARARAQAQARLNSLLTQQAHISDLTAQFGKLTDAWTAAWDDGTAVGQKRHDSHDEDAQKALAQKELADVVALQQLNEALRPQLDSIASAYATALGDGAVAGFQSTADQYVQTEALGLNRWWRAIQDITDSLTNDTVPSENIEQLYGESDDYDTRAAALNDQLARQFTQLQSQLQGRIDAAQRELAALPPSALDPAPLAAGVVATEDPASPSPVAAQTDDAATSANTQQNAESAEIADSPLTAGNVLPLLRATSGLSVRANGTKAYVTVPDTPARGTADPNRTWVGKMADGRWVGIVPLDSGGSAGIAYALMWVWTDGRAQFVGEIPADNGGLGRLSMSIENGEIHLQWPAYGSSDTKCCPSLVRTKILTLDGIRLRPLSDTTALAGRALSPPAGGVVIYGICNYPSGCGSGDYFDETRPQDLTYARAYLTCLNTDTAPYVAELGTKCMAKAGITEIQDGSNYRGPVVKVSP